MVWSPNKIKQTLEHILPTVQKPGRYVGGEYNQIIKDWNTIQTKVALVFPDIYDLGMSNLGMTILYDLLNQREDVLAERAYAPWVDMEAAMQTAGMPLYSLETKHPLSNFDIIGISLPYETLYTNTLNIMNLAGIPIKAKDRDGNNFPLIVAGGHATFNPEPMHAFIDAFVIGEGEEVIFEILDVYQAWKKNGKTKNALLLSLSKIWGIYIPSLYKAHYLKDGTFSHIEKTAKQASLPIIKRIVPKLPPPTTKFIVPFIDIVHNRASIEIMRGCTRGCRFCHAGMVTRPVRERPVEEIIQSIDEIIENTGFEEIGLLSLSSSDYTHVVELVEKLRERYLHKHLSISLPSLRIETVTVDLMDALASDRRGGFTLAPEAGTERMRRIINKPVPMEQILSTTREIYKHGWNTIKLYFMIGLPSETLDDVQAIADLCRTILHEGHKIIGNRAKVHIGVSTFVPKVHTPFQWVPLDTIERIREKQSLLKRKLHNPGLKLNLNKPEETYLEAWLSRGDRRISEVIAIAWKNGAKFDAWKEHFNFQAWMDAFDIVGLNPSFYT
ncbi:MAG TPA: TIGR03960 family B12-binding radical SAM protein, partial [Anaerolineae bacterium]|nr:TIGR03960 family B12-binding radical SAM protein [Anaerolineae bacterium]